MNKDMYELVARIRDHYQNQQNSSQAIIDVAERLLKVGEKQVLEKYDTGKIKWQTKEGDKGMYEMATKNDNAENPDFKALLAHLKETDGRMRIKKDQMFYWLFESGDAIGRKAYEVKEKAPPPPPNTTANACPATGGSPYAANVESR